MYPYHGLLLCLLQCVTCFCMSAAQYESYSFRNFKEDLMPLTAAYGAALENYAAGNWTGSIYYLEKSLRLHRLWKDSVRHCAVLCNTTTTKEEEQSCPGVSELWVFRCVLVSASCLTRCRAHYPLLELPSAGKDILEEFNTRAPYRYLHHAYSQLKDLQKAVPCAYTFLQRNPKNQEMLTLMEEYKRDYDLSGYLNDYEERPFEAPFVRGVKLISSGDYSTSIHYLEETLRLYLHEYDLCQADCEGVGKIPADKDFYALIADVYIDILRCKLKCEENLMPSIGGYFVEKFVATIYHYLQYVYSKLADARSAVPCVYSYFLFEPDDQVMKQNLLHYKAYSQESDYFRPRLEALKHYNHTVTQKQMLASAEKYLNTAVEDLFGSEEAALLSSESPDAEFEGIGDYEESFCSHWMQPIGKGDAGKSETAHENISVNLH
ncbi:endoplasmic reticulum protein SC65-like [Gouania willdenowi]|uniref:Endoplasmic reticulum protein SC65-like n=1 Tax=Gouania willdenowi TaxID=441366 RepID=A0A8C5ELZ8_GOUWI|nr:endoplasmic reticulum protein SC65-like [Gouania willdenowi]